MQVKHRLPNFRGQVGPVRFDAGVGESEDPEVLALLAEHPDLSVPELEHDEQGDDLHELED